MSKNITQASDYDYVIVGSGFGGSVSALRLSQKGYKVLVIEKGKWYKDNTYAHSAWDIRRWLWMPLLGLRGIMKITVLRHITVYSGVGVGGGSHTYGATLPTPKDAFFKTGSWAKLQNWQNVLKPHYTEALRMLGAQDNPHFTEADNVIKDLATKLGKEDQFHPSRVAIYFSDEKDHGKFVKDPYFGGEGPERRGCIECGSCFTGCRYNAKNTLDKNYLYLAQKLGTEIVAEQLVHDIKPAGNKDGSEGYFISFKSSKPYSLRKNNQVVRAKGVIFSGGVLGTVPLLLKLKAIGSLKRLSDRVGDDIRTNNETLSSVTSFKEGVNFAQGVAIGSVLHTDDHSHLEPINYNAQSTLVKFIHAPNVSGKTILHRAASFAKTMITSPKQNLKVLFAKDWSKKSIILLFMQHLDSTLSLKRGFGGWLTSSLGKGPAPSRYIKESESITKEVEEIVEGKSSTATTEALLGTPSTAHILGGAVMGASENEGVINDKCQVYGYQNMYVCDGSIVSANPGVNPSLSITAISEWAMSHVPDKQSSSLNNEK
ncbi:GMC family oxidoreductase [Endozoicomonas sp. G2_1]|uniref:GMC oxidoreductase n=1 Tax=Endozoicomonas sp. G2_1 TaxID=2821091 RepID=UPI001ADB517C|nr:GMC oxidoreductase [Endozoicomonas sp. G2_1]MBO9489446.1 GMC family oxidoreductase [Endozoicomonas sp. G2_1]